MLPLSSSVRTSYSHRRSMRLAVALFALLITSPASAQQTSLPLAEYVFNLAGLEARIRTAPEIAGEDPKTREFRLRSAQRFDLKDFLRREAATIDSLLPPNEVGDCLTYIERPEAREIGSIVRRFGSLDTATAELEKLDPRIRRDFSAFFNSHCVQRTMSLLSVPEVRSAVRSYGVELVCKELEENDREWLERLKESGTCPVVKIES